MSIKSRAGLAGVWFVLVAIAVVGRLWQPTWRGEPLWNVTPMAGVALAAGAMLPNAAVAATVPLAALAISNLALPGYGSTAMAVIVFAATAFPVLLGRFVGGGKWPAVLGGALASSLVFFVTTNFACWALSTMYPHTAAGLMECFVAALPFYRWMPVGDLAWTAAIFGGMKAAAITQPTVADVAAETSPRT